MLSESEVARYLLDQGLLEARSAVHGRLTVRRLPGRNLNHEVAADGAPRFVVKQDAGPGEAALYERLDPRCAPRLHAYDADRRVLVLALEGDVEHDSIGRYSQALAGSVGTALATVHSATTSETGVPAGPPWILGIHRPWIDGMHDTSGASLELIRLVQRQPELGRLLDELRDDWRAQCLVHNDFRWESCLPLSTGMRLIDWEAACPGDPAWDVGSALADYLGSWLLSIPATGSEPPERFGELARNPLAQMLPALRALWEGYVRRAGLSPAAANVLLVRSVRFAAARLLQTAFDQTQVTAAMPGTARCLVQVALDILRRPREATVRLLDIPLAREAAAA